MIKIANKEDLCQISLTGVRALVILTMLMDAPRSLDEIKSALVNYNIMNESSSYDIIRIDLNTLKLMGCEITSARQSTNYKYKLISHPFALEFTDDELKLLKRVYRSVKDSLNVKQLIEYDSFFKKLANFINNNEHKNFLLGISSLKGLDIEEIKQIQQDCLFNKVLHLVYKSPTSKQVSEKEIIANSVVVKNDKIYLYGFDITLKEHVTLLIKRIISILDRKNSDGNDNMSSVSVKFKLKNFNSVGLDDNEVILSGDIENGYIIEGNYYNEFLAVQRILSLGFDCTVIEPADFKCRIIKALSNMREIYNAKGSTED